MAMASSLLSLDQRRLWWPALRTRCQLLASSGSLLCSTWCCHAIHWCTYVNALIAHMDERPPHQPTSFACSVFGPSAKAAQLEGSKSFLKALCGKYDIPTAASHSFRDAGAAKDYIRQQVAKPANGLLRLPLVCIVCTTHTPQLQIHNSFTLCWRTHKARLSRCEMLCRARRLWSRQMGLQQARVWWLRRLWPKPRRPWMPCSCIRPSAQQVSSLVLATRLLLRRSHDLSQPHSRS